MKNSQLRRLWPTGALRGISSTIQAATTGRRWAITYGTGLTAVQDHGAATLDWWSPCTLTAQ